ncbi:MAG TPA: HDOD domain-containing protein [Arenimonas sp.]|nr:HDOD domain-containing protein [Arenimonas sp.]
MSSAARQAGLEFWQKRLLEQEMPVLANTATSIVRRTGEDDTSAMELARLILRDASMTTRVLRMANSFYYNPGTGKITTISRAIVLLGFDAVRNICLSISLVDTFLEGPHRELVIGEMAHCFHAAVQAKALAKMARQKDPEEVFIATLLYHLGPLAFWCFAGDIENSMAERVRQAIERGTAPEQAQDDVLGFRLQQLTEQLNQHWGLSTLLGNALDHRQSPTVRTRAIGFGHDLAYALAGSPGAPDLDKVLKNIERDMKLSAGEVRAQAIGNARDAAEAIASLGLKDAAKLIPSPEKLAKKIGIDSDVHELEVQAQPSVEAAPPTGQQLQMEILRELSLLLEEPSPNINLLIEMVLEGIYRGIGMDRAVFALLSPDRKQIRTKFALGSDRDEIKSSFAFANDPDRSAIAYALQQGQPQWLGKGRRPVGLPYDASLEKLAGGEYFLYPLSVGGKPIGCVYADAAASKRSLDPELFAQFKLFGQQARLGLNLIKGG